MCHGARVDEARNSSSRVQRHLTGAARLQREQRADRVGRGVDLAAEAAADGAADELQLVQRHLEVRRDDAHREVHRLRARVDRQPAARLRDREARPASPAASARSPAGGRRPRRSCPPARTPSRCRPCARGGGCTGRSADRRCPSGGSAARRGRAPGGCRRAPAAPRTRSRSPRPPPARPPPTRPRPRRSAGPCSEPRRRRAAARRRGRRALRGARRRSAARRRAVMIACTPFIASAFDVSSFVIAAWWCGERSAFTQSVRPTRTSSTYCVRPVTWPTPS